MQEKQLDAQLQKLVEDICTAEDVNEKGENLSEQELDERVEKWAAEGKEILQIGGKKQILDEEDYAVLDDCFKRWEENQTKADNEVEFELLEAFVVEEQDHGRTRRKKARVLAASEEVRLAADVAELKGYRSSVKAKSSMNALNDKIADVEKAYVSRKMVFAKASQLATSDCRKQFARVRGFFQTLQGNRQKKLKLQHQRELILQSIMHRLRDTDTRVRELEKNTLTRVFLKKQSNLNETNMKQNLEEAVYLESIIDLLQKVQEAKEEAAAEHFRLQVNDLKNQQKENQRRDDELSKFKAEATLEMARVVAHYVEEDLLNIEDDAEGQDRVDMLERRKAFSGSSSKTILSVSELYDTILWSVATSQLGLSTDGDSLYSSVFDGEANEGNADDQVLVEGEAGNNNFMISPSNDAGSVQSGNTTDSEEDHKFSPVGNIRVKQLTRELRREEKAMIKRHAAERKLERRKFRQQARELKRKHQANVDALLAKCVDERHRLREAIAQRMNALKNDQEVETKDLRDSIEGDAKAMQGAWEEQKRLEEEQTLAFEKAQGLISSQVFHEIRNALSSVVAMSEMTSSLQKDPTVSSRLLVESVSEMLGQNKEVVNHSLNMLNNILDVSKIKAGSFETSKKEFDIQELLVRATSLLQGKAEERGLQMSFIKSEELYISYSDEEIVCRIIKNFISNAIKCTSSGAVQPFVCPIKEIETKEKSDKEGKILQREKNDSGQQGATMVAVGVAHTGSGLNRELLDVAKTGMFSSGFGEVNSSAKNSGFSLHLANQLAGTIETEVYLTDLNHFRDLFNQNMLDALRDSGRGEIADGDKNEETSGVKPNFGSVLYITLPLMQIDEGKRIPEIKTPKVTYTFRPQSVLDDSNVNDRIFRVLVADDVPMLRKGLVRAVMDIFSEFSDCPVSISTACTAEDSLRALKAQPYDLFICDNQFASPDQLLPKIEKDEEGNTAVRPQVFHNQMEGDKSTSRESIINFFANEKFTVEEDDGTLSGLDALYQLLDAEKEGNKIEGDFHSPVLMLLSGHKFTLPEDKAIMVVQKPLKKKEFVPLLEEHADRLLKLGFLRKGKSESDGNNDGKGEGEIVFNKRGTQMFTRKVES